jgi:hypothetical protein
MRETMKQRRKKMADWKRDQRADRDARGVCRTCEAPVALSARTGLPAKQCSRHLACDVRRKTVYILPWEVGREIEYPLGAQV